MTASYRRRAEKSSTAPDTRVGKRRHARRLIVPVMRMVRDRFGAKASLELALRTEADQRSAERWLAKNPGGISADNFAELICSDIGDLVLTALMGPDSKQWPAWYGGFRRQMKLSTLRQSVAAQQRLLEDLERDAGR